MRAKIPTTRGFEVKKIDAWLIRCTDGCPSQAVVFGTAPGQDAMAWQGYHLLHAHRYGAQTPVESPSGHWYTDLDVLGPTDEGSPAA